MEEKSDYALQKKENLGTGKSIKQADCRGYIGRAFFQDNLGLTNWVNSQNIGKTLYCLGDGHDGIWNLFAEIADSDIRQEILDWYHLKENLYKI